MPPHQGGQGCTRPVSPENDSLSSTADSRFVSICTSTREPHCRKRSVFTSPVKENIEVVGVPRLAVQRP